MILWLLWLWKKTEEKFLTDDQIKTLEWILEKLSKVWEWKIQFNLKEEKAKENVRAFFRKFKDDFIDNFEKAYNDSFETLYKAKAITIALKNKEETLNSIKDTLTAMLSNSDYKIDRRRSSHTIIESLLSNATFMRYFINTFNWTTRKGKFWAAIWNWLVSLVSTNDKEHMLRLFSILFIDNDWKSDAKELYFDLVSWAKFPQVVEQVKAQLVEAVEDRREEKLKESVKELKPETIVKSSIPTTLDDIIWQNELINNLKIKIKSIRNQREDWIKAYLGHILLIWPSWYGKTTIIKAVANEVWANLKIVMANSISSVDEMYELLKSRKEWDFLFIDEIHNLSQEIWEALYYFMETREIIETWKPKPTELPPFTIWGATTNEELMHDAFRSRFQSLFVVEYWEEDKLKMVTNHLNILKVVFENSIFADLAKYLHHSPRNIRKFCENMQTYAIANKVSFNLDTWEQFKNDTHIYVYGLETKHIEYIKVLRDKFNWGPASLNKIAAILWLNTSTVEEIEKDLFKNGIVALSSMWRMLVKEPA